MQLYLLVRRASIMRYISFGYARLKRQQLIKIFPEIARMLRNCFMKRPIDWWQRKMSRHNQVVQRAIRMKFDLRSTSRRPIVSNLDQFIMKMYSPQIAQVLDCFLDFGMRIVPLIQKQPTAPEWWISEEVLMHRHHWFEMCRSVMDIVRLAGTVEHGGCPSVRLHERRLVCKELEVAAQAAVSLFGPFTDLGQFGNSG